MKLFLSTKHQMRAISFAVEGGRRRDFSSRDAANNKRETLEKNFRAFRV